MTNTLENIITITNRHIAESYREGSFLSRIEELCQTDTKAIVLREKDMNENDYLALATTVNDICLLYNKKLIIHSYPSVAHKLNIDTIHMPINLLKNNPDIVSAFKYVGTSVHSLDDIAYANSINLSYVIAGHIYKTDCKKGLEPRGLDFLKAIVDSANMPVYAIGGITMDKLPDILSTGAAGGCMMSSLMKGERLPALVAFKKSDIDEVFALYQSAIGTDGCVWNDNYPTKALLLEDIETNNLYGFKDEQGRIIASIAIDRDEAVDSLEYWSNNKPAAELARLVISEAYKNKGLARTLIRQTMQVLKAKGYKQVHFLVAVDNKRAINSYRKLNFEKVGDTFMFNTDYMCFEKAL